MVNWFKKSPTPAPRTKGPGKAESNIQHPKTPQPISFGKNQPAVKSKPVYPSAPPSSLSDTPRPLPVVEYQPPTPPVEKVITARPSLVRTRVDTGVGSDDITVKNSSTSTTTLVTNDVSEKMQNKGIDLSCVEEVLCQLLKRTEYLKCNIKKPAIVKLCIDVNKTKKRPSVCHISDSDSQSDCCEMSPDVRVLRKSRRRRRSKGGYQECSCSCQSSRHSCCR